MVEERVEEAPHPARVVLTFEYIMRPDPLSDPRRLAGFPPGCCYHAEQSYRAFDAGKWGYVGLQVRATAFSSTKTPNIWEIEEHCSPTLWSIEDNAGRAVFDRRFRMLREDLERGALASLLHCPGIHVIEPSQPEDECDMKEPE